MKTKEPRPLFVEQLRKGVKVDWEAIMKGSIHESSMVLALCKRHNLTIIEEVDWETLTPVFTIKMEDH